MANKWRKLVYFKKFCSDGDKRNEMFVGLLCKVQRSDAFLKRKSVT